MTKNAKSALHPGSRPPSAVEVTPEGVLAAALQSPGRPPRYAFVPLPPGALVPAIGEPNLHSSEVVTKAIRSALDEVSPRRRAVTLVLPDSLVRVFMLDFDSLPTKPAEIVQVLRFRLRKMVPFDAEQASVGYQVLSHSKSEYKVLAAILPGPILAEYENAISGADYETGAVLPSSLAALETLDPQEAALTANLTAAALTTAIADRNDLLLYRTLDLPADPAQRIPEVQRGIAVATAYFEDRMGAHPRVLYYTGHEDARTVAQWLNDPEMDVVDMARADPGQRNAIVPASAAGVAGALTGVR